MPEIYEEYLMFLRVFATIVIFEIFFVTIDMPTRQKCPARSRARTTKLRK